MWLKKHPVPLQLCFSRTVARATARWPLLHFWLLTSCGVHLLCRNKLPFRAVALSLGNILALKALKYRAVLWKEIVPILLIQHVLYVQHGVLVSEVLQELQSTPSEFKYDINTTAQKSALFINFLFTILLWLPPDGLLWKSSLLQTLDIYGFTIQKS